MNGIFCVPRHFIYRAARAAFEFRFRHPILCNSSRRCRQRYAQTRRPADAHSCHMQSLYFRFRLRVVNACVFLKSALGCPERCQNKGYASHSSRMRTAFLCLSAAETAVRNADKSGLRVLTPGSNKVDFVHSVLRSDGDLSGLPRDECEAGHRAKVRKTIRGGNYDSSGTFFGEQSRLSRVGLVRHGITLPCRASLLLFLGWFVL